MENNNDDGTNPDINRKSHAPKSNGGKRHYTQYNGNGGYPDPKSQEYYFRSEDDLLEHAGRHIPEIKKAFGYDSYDVSDYLAGANAVIKNGTYVEEMNAYVMYVCDDKYVVVGMSRDQSYITTYHVKSAAKLAKKAPSLFGGS